MKTITINGVDFEHVTAPKMIEKICNLNYCGGLSNWYTKCSDTKQRIYDEWVNWFNQTATGHCSFGISSANSMTFTITCDIRIDNQNYRMYITPSHNYIIYME